MSVGVQLGVELSKIDSIIADNNQYPGPQQKAFQVLRAWRDMGTTSTTERLSEVLIHVGREDLAEELQNQQVNGDHKISTYTLDNKKDQQ